MKVLVTGARGMLARDLVPTLAGDGHEVTALDRDRLDVTDGAAVAACVQVLRPDVVVQCAAYTAVDDAETEVAKAFRVNAEGARHAARACQKIGALFVYPSTDYVFDGMADSPYRPDDVPAPINAYGRSKLAGEEAAREAEHALVVRTSWLYGEGGRNFVDTIRSLSRQRAVLNVVDDQLGRPTWTVSLSRCLARLLTERAVGTFHAAGGGDPVTWYGVARELLEREGSATAVVAVSTSAFPRPAARPRYSVLDCSGTEAVVGMPMPDWKETLAGYLRSTAAQ